MTKKKLILAVLLGATLGSTSAMQQNSHNDTPILGAEWVAPHSLLVCENSYKRSTEHIVTLSNEIKESINICIRIGLISAGANHSNVIALCRGFKIFNKERHAVFAYMKQRNTDLNNAAAALSKETISAAKERISDLATIAHDKNKEEAFTSDLRNMHDIHELSDLANALNVDIDVICHMYHRIYDNKDAKFIFQNAVDNTQETQHEPIQEHPIIDQNVVANMQKMQRKLIQAHPIIGQNAVDNIQEMQYEPIQEFSINLNNLELWKE